MAFIYFHDLANLQVRTSLSLDESTDNEIIQTIHLCVTILL